MLVGASVPFGRRTPGVVASVAAPPAIPAEPAQAEAGHSRVTGLCLGTSWPSCDCAPEAGSCTWCVFFLCFPSMTAIVTMYIKNDTTSLRKVPTERNGRERLRDAVCFDCTYVLCGVANWHTCHYTYQDQSGTLLSSWPMQLSINLYRMQAVNNSTTGVAMYTSVVAALSLSVRACGGKSKSFTAPVVIKRRPTFCIKQATCWMVSGQVPAIS